MPSTGVIAFVAAMAVTAGLAITAVTAFTALTAVTAISAVVAVTAVAKNLSGCSNYLAPRLKLFASGVALLGVGEGAT